MTYRISITVEKLDPELLESCLRHGRISITWQGGAEGLQAVSQSAELTSPSVKRSFKGRKVTSVPHYHGKQKVREVALQWLVTRKVSDLVDLRETGELASAIASHGYKASNVHPVGTKLVRAGFIKRSLPSQAIIIALPSKQGSPS